MLAEVPAYDRKARIKHLEWEVAQLQSILKWAPMVNVDYSEKSIYLKRFSTPFAYMHPKTFRHFERYATRDERFNFFYVPGRPTKIYLNSMIPEDRVLLTTEPIPQSVADRKPKVAA